MSNEAQFIKTITDMIDLGINNKCNIEILKKSIMKHLDNINDTNSSQQKKTKKTKKRKKKKIARPPLYISESSDNETYQKN